MADSCLQNLLYEEDYIDKRRINIYNYIFNYELRGKE